MKHPRIKAEKREEKRKKKTEMLVSGKSVFAIRNIIVKKSRKSKQ